MKKVLNNLVRFVLFPAIGAGILVWMYRSQNQAYQEECVQQQIAAEDCSLWDKIITDFASANYWWIFLVLAAFTVSNLSRTSRWIMLMRPLGYNVRYLNGFGSILIGYFANLAIPRIGEVVRAGTLAQYERIAVEKVMGTVVVDRTIDVISILLITLLALFLEYDNIWGAVLEHQAVGDKLGGWQQLLVYAGLAALAFGGLFLLFRKRLQKTKIFQKIVGILLGFIDGIKTIGKLDRPWWFVLHSINIWLMYFLMTYFCFFAFAPTSHLGPVIALVVFVFGGWGIVFPSPGGMGTYHYMVTLALGIYGVGADDGFSFANIAFFSIQLGANVLLGGLALFLLPVFNRNYQPAQHVATTTD